MQHKLRKPQPHIPPSAAAAAISAAIELHRVKKSRGSYNCGQCGLPKKGHVCQLPGDSVPTTPTASDQSGGIVASSSSRSTVRSVLAPPRQSCFHLRRALSFDDSQDECDFEAASAQPDLDLDLDQDTGLEINDVESGGLPAVCLWEVLRRLPPSGLLMAARVCKGWRETARRMWRAAEELRVTVPVRAQIGYIGSLLQKGPGLVRLSLKMESDLDATMLACIAFSCPNLEALEISISGTAINRINGEELGRFVADKRRLTSLRMEGCSNLGGFVLCSSSLSTLWFSDLHSLSRMVFNCPNLREMSLEFSRQQNDTTDLVTMVNGLGRTSPRLQNIHIASLRLSHAVVLALTAANFRGLQMLSLVLGSEISDASVAAIASSYSDLELLDLSGSGISDSGIGMICNAYPDTLSKLLLALCPNITSSGIQFAAAQLPLLELMDCGMTICDPSSEDLISVVSDGSDLTKTTNNKQHLIYQKMFIKHSRLKKLSLWGCSSLDALYLNCPELNDLNLNSCINLHPERLMLQCPKLKSVHASGCQELLIGAVKRQVSENFATKENLVPCRRLADGSKRVRAPQFLNQQLSEDGSRKRARVDRHQCKIILD